MHSIVPSMHRGKTLLMLTPQKKSLAEKMQMCATTWKERGTWHSVWKSLKCLISYQSMWFMGAIFGNKIQREEIYVFENSNKTFLVIFKHCEMAILKKYRRNGNSATVEVQKAMNEKTRFFPRFGKTRWSFRQPWHSFPKPLHSTTTTRQQLGFFKASLEV